MNIFSFSPFGYEGAMVNVEVDLRRGIPSVDVVGLADGAVKESRERMRAAIRNCGFEFPQDRVLISLSPADVKKEGAGFDLAIALAVLAAKNSFDGGEDCLVMGELDLSGNIRPVRGINAAVSTAKEQGIKWCIIPSENEREALNCGLGVCAVENLSKAFECLASAVKGEKPYSEAGASDAFAHETEEVCFAPLDPSMDFSSVKNQGKLVRALQIAAAGGHNLIAYGPPGCGKTLSIQRIPSILPCLSLEESRTVTRIYSLAGLIPPGGEPIKARPFRAPHQSATLEGMAGGGNQCRPGEVSLAHNGVLFLDEAAEFRTNVLQSLRIPLELGSITLSRAGRHTVFPARFQLFMAANPCPCGNYGSENRICVCSPHAVETYWKKLSGPLLDRIDIRVPLLDSYSENSQDKYEYYNNVSSAKLRPSIALAVHMQRRRQGKNNASLTPEEISTKIVLEEDAESTFEELIVSSNFSGRAEHSILKLSRTIADLEGCEKVSSNHIAEAYEFRKNEGGLEICF
ncbi:MAG: YifB family Mg chelatase-like AAA ATPase [Spirochaetaceae bacterium]|nr:YifB family Mg chelatase-like AAA ATPase [Spirochaetaceae bacterium]MBR4826098.1 YifB family Mg chelatase-like AAA ATPase [Spirochaetaceae bacterium]